MADGSSVDQKGESEFSPATTKDLHHELQMVRITTALEDANGPKQNDDKFIRSVETSFDVPSGLVDEWQHKRLLSDLKVNVNSDVAKEVNLEGTSGEDTKFFDKWRATSNPNLYVVEQVSRGREGETLLGREFSVVSNAYKKANNLH
jgi:hypothetical protein